MAGVANGPITSLASDLQALQLDRYLLDTAVIDRAAADLTAWLRDQTGIPVPGAVVRLGCRVVSAALFNRLKHGADRAFSSGLALAISAFEQLPGAERFCSAMRDWARKQAADREAMARLDALLAGERLDVDIEQLQTLSIDLRLQLEQVSRLEGVRHELTASFAAILQKLDRQPQLDPKLVALTATSRLYFGARKVSFLGREAEFGQLLDFLYSDADMAWWLMTGPGGMGKSRLALELCHRAGACWRTGFLPQAEIERFAWADWQPDLPHLVVVDYAAALPQAVGRMLEALRLRQHNTPLEMPVRVLLLERHRDERWWTDLLHAGERHGLEQALADAEPLALPPLGADGIWAMLEALGDAAATALGKAVALEQLAAIDPAMRPLFAALAGDALAEDADLRQWNRTALLDDWLRREQHRHWRPAGVDDPHTNLAALATMVGGIAEDVLAQPPDGIALPRPEAISGSVYAAITGRPPLQDDVGTTWFAAIEPDLLGTFTVLRHLEAPLGKRIAVTSAVADRADRYRDAAWARGGADALGFASFLDRAKDDFLDHGTLRPLLAPPREGRWQRWLWGMLVVNLLAALGEDGRLDEARGRLDLLGDLALHHPDEPGLRLELANGSFNLINGFLKAGWLDAACDRLDQLRDLARDHPDEPELRLQLAKGSVNLISGLGEDGRLDEADTRVDQLRDVARDHPGEPELRLCLAKGSVNLINGFLQDGRLDEADTRVDQLRDVARNHPGEPELRLCLAKGSFNLIYGFLQGGRLDDANARLELLRDLARDHPDEPPLVGQAGLGTVSLIGAYIEQGNREVASAVARGVPDLLRSAPLRAELRQRLADDRTAQLEQLIEVLLTDG